MFQNLEHPLGWGGKLSKGFGLKVLGLEVAKVPVVVAVILQ
jgi:hypothetical protein